MVISGDKSMRCQTKIKYADTEKLASLKPGENFKFKVN
jgi:hypothetical protein